ncbi:unnamed protein product [Cyclocybe aegerita]|uniref:Pre-mRNA-splicing factor RSE1 n=1 Tax=Cyclocybe aegerita TaxID=1973307 RepID=A0A8S0W3A8_CYCAE|nr:unnamed protein product [Cyclocybe aegerita]
MHLYNLTIQPPTAITQAIVGNFSGVRQQEIVVSHGTRLELLQSNAETGKLTIVNATDAFGFIRSLAAFRLTGGTKDYMIVGSDSGRIVILEYDFKTGSFVKVHQETYGKSGVRRVVPGQYLVIDPKGRSVMIAAIEKSKLVYVLNRDSEMKLTISSPLEAHKNAAIVHHVVSLDVGFENPVFAALEVDYSEVDQDSTGEAFNNATKILTYYELDLGLNHIVRKWSEPTDFRANLLVQVPGSLSISSSTLDGPSGVLVCCEDHIIYRHMNVASHRVPIPRRQHPLEDTTNGLIMTAAVMHKMKHSFFFLLQSEVGDLYKVTIEHEEQDVKSLTIKYFDTIPVASSLCILKSGHLFVASEFGNHVLYQFTNLGEDDEPVITSTSYPQFGMADPTSKLPQAFFRPRPLSNLISVDQIPSLDPILDAKVLKMIPNSESPQIFAACGRGPRSTFRTLQPGLEVEESVTYDLGSQPNAIWAIKSKEDDPYDSYIILSFLSLNKTLVLSVNDDTIEQIQDIGFLDTVPTLGVQQLGASCLLQVYPFGIRQISADKCISEWKAPEGNPIVGAAMNKRQVVLALSSAEIVYFEMDLDGQLNEYQEKQAMGSRVLALGIGEVPHGRQRSPYLAVGCEDQTVRIISLDPEHTLETVSLQALTAPPSSICIVDMVNPSADNASLTTFVNIGLQNGVLLRTVLDPVNGQLVDTRSRFLGTRPVKLVRLQINSKPAMLALSSRSWLSYTYQNASHFAPLIYDGLDCASGLSTANALQGLLGISGSNIRIFQVTKLGQKLKQESIQLSYTPRKFISHPNNRYFYVIESDHRVMGDEAAKKKIEELHQNDEEIDQAALQLPSAVFGRPRAPAGTWGSCIRIIDPLKSKTVNVINLEGNEATFSLALVPFSAQDGRLHLIVGTAVNTLVSPRSCSTGYLRTYMLTDDGAGLELVHKTEVDDVPLALVAFQGRLLAGVGKALRIYDIGQKKLLRKAENKASPTTIVSLATQGSRIVVGDMQESILFTTYKEPENRLLIFADDSQPRWITGMTMVDYNTVFASDRFGNIFVNRLDSNISDLIDTDPAGAGILHEKSTLNGAPYKTKMLAHFHVGDLITSIHKTSLVAGGREVLVYTGLHGTIGILVPFVSKDDIELLSSLEQYMRTQQNWLSLIGRDQMSWRGYYVPVKGVIDGDLCEMFKKLPGLKQQGIAGGLDRTVGEVVKKLEQLRLMASDI